MAPLTPSPEVKKVVDAAKAGKTERIGQTEFAVVIDSSEQLKEHAQNTLKTRKEWEALRAILTTEKTDKENKDIVEDKSNREKLVEIEKAIQVSIDATDTVSDFEAAPDPTKPQKFFDQVKSVFSGATATALGMLVRGWISVQRMMISVGAMRGDAKQLDEIEKLYGKFFGTAEAIGQGNTLLNPLGINVVKGKQDSTAYAELKRSFLLDLGKQLKDQTPELATQIREDYTFGKFLETKITEYGATHGSAKGRTTLTGILKNQAPAEEAKPAV